MKPFLTLAPFLVAGCTVNIQPPIIPQGAFPVDQVFQMMRAMQPPMTPPPAPVYIMAPSVEPKQYEAPAGLPIPLQPVDPEAQRRLERSAEELEKALQAVPLG